MLVIIMQVIILFKSAVIFNYIPIVWVFKGQKWNEPISRGNNTHYHPSDGNPGFLLVESPRIYLYIPPGAAYSGQFLVSKSMFLGDNTIIPPLDNDIKLWTNRSAGK